MGFGEEHELLRETARKFREAECDTKFVASGWRPPRRCRTRPGGRQRVLDARQYAITGGTSEIQRNIVGERVLALPKR